MKNLKRIMSICLCLTLFMTSFQNSVSAEELTQEETEPTTSEVQNNTSEEFVQSYQNASFQIVFKDDEDADQRRKDINQMIHLYQDGVEIHKTLQLQSETEENGMNIYTYLILNLPIYKENSDEVYSYTLKEDSLPGYTTLAGTYIGSNDTLTFTNDGSSFVSSQVFGNELKTYNVSGTITFDEENDLEIKNTLDQIFPNIVKTYKEVDTKTWNFTLQHLYTTDKNGNAASYSYDYSLDGWNVNEISPITSDTKLEINYTKNKKESKTSKNEKETDNDSDESDLSLADTSIEYNGKKSFALNWYDDITFGRSNYGSLTLTIDNQKFSYTFDGNSWATQDTSDVYDLSKITFTMKSNNAQYQEVEITGIPSKIDEKDIASSLTYSLSDSDYTVEENSETYNIYKLTEYKIDIVISNGGQEISDLHTYFELKSDNEDLNNKLDKNDYKLSSPSISLGKSTYTLTVSGLKQYEASGDTKSLIVYDALVKNMGDDGTISLKDGDKFAVTYDNTGVANYGNDTSSIKNGGELDLLLTGTTSYSGTKIWLTEKEHPTATWTLWRYSKKANVDYTKGSQVNEDLNQESISSWNAKNGGTWTVDNLPKYDTDGYTYVYFAKENMSDKSYVRHYGTIENNFEDDVNADGKTRAESTRNGDTSIYNGGTLTNRIESTISTTVTKVWVADFYASKLNDVSVSVKLQVKKRTDSSWTDYTNEKGNTVIHELKDYNVETGNPTYSMDVDKYDKNGNEVEYRWVEISIKDSDTENALSEDGKKAILSVNKNAKDGDEYFIETSSTNNNETTLTSTLTGTTNYYIHKEWVHNTNTNLPTTLNVYFEQLDKTNTKTDSDYNKTITLNRNDQGNTDTYWSYTISDLPKFDHDGGKFIYQVREQSLTNYILTYENNKQDKSSNIDNVKYGYNNIFLKNTYVEKKDPRQQINIRKVWYDDGDSYQRKDITIEVLADDNTVLAKTMLSESDNWLKNVTVTAYKYEVNGKTVITKKSDTPDEFKKDANLYSGGYKLKETKVGDYIVENDQVTTDQTSYKVSYSKQNDYYTIINRRVGTVDLSVTKTWKDGKQDVATRKSYNASVQLTTDNDGVTIENNSIKIVNETTSITSNDGTTVVDSTQSLTGDDGQTIYFYNLPKYDAKGKFIEYKVIENDPDKKLSENDYKTTIDYSEYKIGNVQESEHDSQAISILNKRSQTKTVTFYKLWKDTYVYSKKQRPDIYLTLYSNATKINGKYFVSDKIKQVSTYIDCLWSQKDQTDLYKWSCKFENLPQYDENGAEITYYASENTHVDTESLDYESVKYKEGKPSDSGEGTDSITAISSDNVQVLKEGNTFVNGLKSSVTVQGLKVWKNIPKGFPNSQLPSVTFYLDQYIGNELKKENIANITIDGSSTSDLSYNFYFKYQGENNVDGTYKESETPETLDKYNENGELYTYKVREAINDISVKSLITSDPSAVNDNYYTVTNTYKNDTSNVSNITVNKSWAGLDNYSPGFKYPALTFELHRVTVDSNGDKITDSDTVVETKKMNKNNKEESISFKNQLIYAPNGKKFQYYIVEKIVNGYTTSTNNWDIDHTFELDTTDKTIKFTNTYDQYGQTTYSGKKIWDDFDDLMGNRPDSVTLTLYRKTSTIASQQVGTLTLKKDSTTFTKSSDLTNKSGNINSTNESNEWSYMFSNLDKIAPDGQSWQYFIKEEDKANDYYDAGTVKKSDVTNTLTRTSITATKKWENINPNLETESVELTLIVKEKGDSTWQWASDYFNKSNSITYTNTIKSSSKTITFNNLPKYAKNKSGKELIYGVRETKIGNKEVNFKENTTEYADNDVYTVENTDDTTVKNTLKHNVSLKITKKWVDQDNKYGLRNSDWTVKYHVYRQIENSNDELVKNSKGQSYVLTVSGTNNSNEESTTLNNLPSKDSEGNVYTYSVKEISNNGAYTSTITNEETQTNGFVYTNTNTLETKDVHATKIWDDTGVSARPSSIEFTIYQNGQKLSDKINVSKNNDWKGTASNLPKKDKDGKEYTYTVKEERLAGYMNPTYSDDGLIVTNTITSFHIDGSNMAGFKLSGNGYEATWNKDKEGNVSTKVTKNSETIYTGSEIKGLDLGDYTLTETNIPDGYEKMDDVKVKISIEKGKLVITSESNNVSFKNNTLKITSTPTSITLNKVDYDTGESIENDTYAAFTISDGKTSYNVTSQNILSELKGKLVVGNEYTLKEISTLDTYYNPGLTTPFKLDEKGNIQVSSNEYVSAEGSTFTIKNKKFTSKLSLHKIDKTDHSAINNVTFDLYYSTSHFDDINNGTLVESQTTDDSGNVSFTLNKKGHYLVYEKINQGYVLAGHDQYVGYSATFEVKDSDYNKTLTTNNLQTLSGEVDSKGSILNTRKMGKVILKKLNEDQETLNGVQFKLYKEVEQSWITELFTGKKYEFIESKKVSDLGDGENGILSIDKLEWGTYKLEEVTGKNGYTILNDQGKANSVEFTINRDTFLKEYYVIDAGTLTNKKNKVSIEKTDENGKIIRGAEFKLEGLFADGSTSKTLKDQSTLTGQLIGGQSYTLTETKAPDGYKVNTQSYTFKVDSNGSDLIGEIDSHYSITGTTIKAKDDPISIKFMVNGGQLNGAQFTLTDITDTSIETKTFTVNGTNTLNMNDYKWIGGHSYSLKETCAPDGYKLAKTIEFTIHKDGTINGSTMIDIDHDPIKISLKKTDAYSKEVLEGVPFVVKQNDKEITQGITNDQGTLTFNLVQNKTYDLYEEVYNGYVQKETQVLSFTVQEDGTVDKTGNPTIQLTNTRIPGVINVTKVDSAKKDKKLKGAEFTLYTDVDCSKKVSQSFDGEKLKDGYGSTLKTDENGQLSFNNLAWGTYYLKETKAPKGYKLNSSVYTITLNKSDTSVDVYANQEIKNEMNSISIIKTDGAKNLKGAEFELSGEFTDDTTSKTWTSGEDMYTLTGLLIVGNEYTLKETKAPAGYVLEDESSVTFTMMDDGTISMNDTDKFSGNGGNLITVKDIETSITVHKIDNETQENLAGANLEIYKATDFDEDKPKEGASAVKFWICTANDQVIKGLETGVEYVLYEKKGVSSYDSFNPIHFSLNANGTLKNQSSNVITAENKRIRAQFEIIKKGESEDGIVSGIEYSLYSNDGQLMAEHLTTDENGHWSSSTSSESYSLNGKTEEFSKGLPTGSYYLIETKASKNTSLSKDKYEFSVGDSNTGAMNKVVLVEITNKMFVSKIHLNIIDSTTKNPLDNVSFELYLNGECIDTQVTENGVITFDIKEKGEYTIKERDNPGYRSNDLFECTFTIDDEDYDQNITVNKDSRFTIKTGTITEDGIINDPLTVFVEKKNENWQDLSGAEFVISPNKGSSFVNHKDSLSLDEISGQLIVGNSYILSETKAPNGYQKAKDVEFTIDGEGQITLIGQQDYVRVKGLNTIELKDEPVKEETTNTGVNTNIQTYVSTGILSLCFMYFLWDKNRRMK